MWQMPDVEEVVSDELDMFLSDLSTSFLEVLFYVNTLASWVLKVY